MSIFRKPVEVCLLVRCSSKVALVGALFMLLLLGACAPQIASRAPPDAVAVRGGDAAAVLLPRTAVSAGKAIMMEALAGMRAGRAAEALPQWRRALVEYPELRDYHLYYLGLAEASAGDLAGARRELETLLREEPESVLVPQAALRLGCLLAESEPAAATAHLWAARTHLVKGSGDWAKASLTLATLEMSQGRMETARHLLVDVRGRVGPGIARRRARRIAERLGAASPEQAMARPTRAAEEARLLLREGASVEAEDLLLTALEAKPSARLRPRLLSLLASAQHQQGRLEVAERTMRRLLADHASHTLAPRGMLTLAKWRWNRDDDALALEWFVSFLRRYPRHSQVPEALHSIGRIHQSAGRFAAARAAYEGIARRFPTAELAADARWRLGWIEYLQGRYAAAADSFGQLSSAGEGDRVRERGLYWKARAVERDRGRTAGFPLFAAVVEEFPYGYYAVWAERGLASQEPGVEPAKVVPGRRSGGSSGGSDEASAAGAMPAQWVSEHGGSPRSLAILAREPGVSALDPERFGRAVDLDEMGLSRHAERELDAIPLPPASRADGQLVLLEAYARVGAHHRALGLSALMRPRRSPGDLGHPMDRFLYPRGYWEPVQKHASEHGVDPYLVAALIRQESAFDVDAVSPKGACGLMQLMPATARRVAAGLGLEVPGRRDLSRPEVNVQLGTAYLGQLIAEYGGVVHRALAAYNAGEGAVAKWDLRFQGAAPDEFIEQISFPETQAYVKAVMRNYRVYRSLYGGGDSLADVTSSGGLTNMERAERRKPDRL